MFKRRLWFGICVFLVLIAAPAWWLYRLAVLGPDFYQAAQNIPVQVLNSQGEELESRLLEAHNNAVRQQTWSLEFTDEQLNGWIQSTLPRKYPRFRFAEIENLCLSFQQDKIQIAFRVKQAVIPVVVCIQLAPFITHDEKNIAIRLEKIRTGLIPLPKKRATDQVTQALGKAQVPVVWTVENGQPLGLLPSSFPMAKEIKRTWRIKNLTISDRRLSLSGIAFDSN